MPLLPSTARAEPGAVYVDAGKANLRAGPTTDAAKVQTMARGAALTVVERQGEWIRVRTEAGGEGWIFAELVAESRPVKAAAGPSDAEIKKRLIAESIAQYSGSCPCPYHVDRAGRSCGRRSAYSRPGGEEPLCYPRDVTREMVEQYRRMHPTE